MDASRHLKPRPVFPGPTLLLGLSLFWLMPAGALASESRDLLDDEINTIQVVERYSPSVVAVHVTVDDVRMHPMMDPGEQEGGGSGFIVDDEGRIVTNFHVVAAALEEHSVELQENAKIRVSFLENTEKEYEVRVLGAIPDFDLALLEYVNSNEIPSLDPIPLGDSDQVRTGQKVIAIGNPFGLHSTVTTGIVSAIEREQPGLIGIEIPFIQTDAAINPGNSGGPLLNSRAEVIGINNAILAAPGGAAGFMGVGLAVPVNLLHEHMQQLVAGGLSGWAAEVAELPDRPRLGLNAPINVADIPEPLRRELELPEFGIIITAVAPGSPAEEAGLQEPDDATLVAGQPVPSGGDIIIGAEGQEIRHIIDLQRIVLQKEAGDVISLTVWREGEERTVEVPLQVVQEEQEEQEEQE